VQIAATLAADADYESLLSASTRPGLDVLQ
jgi:hypothetical protein